MGVENFCFIVPRICWKSKRLPSLV